jgi:hypothetical protein
MLPWAAAAGLLASSAAFKAITTSNSNRKCQDEILAEVKIHIIASSDLITACFNNYLTKTFNLCFPPTFKQPLQYRSIFNVPKDKLEALKATMLTEMDLGLAGEKGGLMMLPSFVDILPTGYVFHFLFLYILLYSKDSL